MKLLNSKAEIGAAAVLLSLALMCFVPVTLAAGIGNGSGAASGSAAAGSTEGLVDEIEGPFGGVDLKARYIWIDDKACRLDRSVRVKGTSTKLGLMSDLKPGEQIKAKLRWKEETPTVVLIERQ